MKQRFLSILICVICFHVSSLSQGKDTLFLPFDASSLTISQQNASPKYIAYPLHLQDQIPEIKCLENISIKANDVTFNMVFVEGGTFMMGATPEQEPYAKDNERPVHEVTLSDYYIAETEVTQELWTAIMGGTNPSKHGDTKQHPVDNVSIEIANRFIDILNIFTGQKFRLPTEAEWEYAARGGKYSKGFLYAGSNNLAEVSVCSADTNYRNGGTEPVATKLPNELGIYDMTGNLLEWCSDKYGPYSIEPQINPHYTDGTYGVVRGGAYFHANVNGHKNSLRLSARISSQYQAIIPNYVGFRLVMDDYNPNKIFSIYGVEFEMLHIEGGTFVMGATSEQGNTSSTVSPTPKVTLSDYYICSTEVTQELWKVVMGNNPSYSNADPRKPVEMVSWEDCQMFINTLNQLTGENFRLPTEAEWEFAARGGIYTEEYTYSGGNNIDSVAWYSGNCSTTQCIKQRQPNEQRIYDMTGNVSEWCSDWYDTFPDSEQVNPIGPSSGTKRICRGGSYKDKPEDCHIVTRKSYEPTQRLNTIGLRLAL